MRIGSIAESLFCPDRDSSGPSMPCICYVSRVNTINRDKPFNGSAQVCCGEAKLPAAGFAMDYLAPDLRVAPKHFGGFSNTPSGKRVTHVGRAPVTHPHHMMLFCPCAPACLAHGAQRVSRLSSTVRDMVLHIREYPCEAPALVLNSINFKNPCRSSNIA